MITTSIFDLFKIGPGPSSSHTIGPMKAAYDFLQRIQALEGDEISVNLYGSLSATGKGHGTDRAVVAGLLGCLPDTIDPTPFSQLLKDKTASYSIKIGSKHLIVNASSIRFEKVKYSSPHPNTLLFTLLKEGERIAEEEYYSVGGGFVSRKGESSISKKELILPFPYNTMGELKEHLKKHQIDLAELVVQNEMALTDKSRKEIYQGVDSILDFMYKAVKRGLKHKGILPGSIKLQRKAPIVYQKAMDSASQIDSIFIFLNAYCLAASEENAAGNIVVTAPTSGASGVIPGVTYMLKNHFHYDKNRLREGMFVAAAIGFLIKHNASISGAEMGCMGEIGSASAMAASLLSACANLSIDKIESAAEIAIEHHLGMTCDPIGGYVQIPCIERNAMGAIKAYNSFLLASSGESSYQKISFDSVLKVMRATGKDMSKKYKETSEAGLALSMTEC